MSTINLTGAVVMVTAGTAIASFANLAANSLGKYIITMPNHSSAVASGVSTGVGLGLGILISNNIHQSDEVRMIHIISLMVLSPAIFTPHVPQSLAQCDVSHLGAVGYGALGTAATFFAAVSFG